MGHNDYYNNAGGPSPTPNSAQRTQSSDPEFEDCTVAWIAPLPIEYEAAEEMWRQAVEISKAPGGYRSQDLVILQHLERFIERQGNDDEARDLRQQIAELEETINSEKVELDDGESSDQRIAELLSRVVEPMIKAIRFALVGYASGA